MLSYQKDRTREDCHAFGFTLIEMMLSVMVVFLVLTVVMALTIGTLHFYARGSNVTYAYMDTNRALEWIAKDVRKSMAASIGNNGTSLTLTIPAVDSSTGCLIQPMISDGQPITYYLGDKDGNTDANGTYVWRQVQGGSRRSMITEVADALFVKQDTNLNMTLVSITLTATRGNGPDSQTRQLTTNASIRN